MDAKGIKELIVLNGRDAELYEGQGPGSGDQGSGIRNLELGTLNLELHSSRLIPNVSVFLVAIEVPRTSLAGALFVSGPDRLKLSLIQFLEVEESVIRFIRDIDQFVQFHL
jgi:hypothetical protein